MKRQSLSLPAQRKVRRIVTETLGDICDRSRPGDVVFDALLDKAIDTLRHHPRLVNVPRCELELHLADVRREAEAALAQYALIYADDHAAEITNALMHDGVSA
jgi:hypothetical protein